MKFKKILPLLLLLLYSSTFVFTEELDVISSLKQLDVAAISVFFIIDHSSSMSGQGTMNAQDRWGERFKAPFALVDSLYNIFDSAEVGIAVFRKYLYFDTLDDSRFVQCPEQDTGAYLPLFKLDSCYAPDGKWGYQIIKEYLDSDTVSSGNYDYVDLQYIPSNLSINDGNTNITAGFNAAKDAFKTARYPKAHQFIIFFSDGIATYPGQQGSPEANQYIEDVKADIPTTFTLYFTQSPDPPQDLVDMTDNIKANGYSASNDSSALWAIDIIQENLIVFILENIFPNFFKKKVPTLIPHPSPTYERRPTLTWHVPEEPGSIYNIQVAMTTDFSTPVIDVSIADTFYTPQTDIPQGTVYWRVSTDISHWSMVSSFIICNNYVPVVIPHESPTDIVKPTLTWHPPQGGAASYTIQISTFLSFDPILLEMPLVDTFFTCQAPLPYCTIFWRVKGDSSDYSPTSSFIIDSVITEVPQNSDMSFSGISCVMSNRCMRILFPGLGGGAVEVTIFDIKGRVAAALRQNHPMRNEILWDYKDTSGKNVSSGIYLIRVKAGNKSFSYKVPVSR